MTAIVDDLSSWVSDSQNLACVGKRLIEAPEAHALGAFRKLLRAGGQERELAAVDVRGVGGAEGDQGGAAALNPKGEVPKGAVHDADPPRSRRSRLVLSVAESRSSGG